MLLGWELGARPAIAKRQEWTGSIAETFKKRKWWRGREGPLGARSYRYYKHYWRVECNDGEKVAVEVPWHIWRNSEVDDPVSKELGERWPRLESRNAERRREAEELLKELMAKRAVSQ